MRLSDDERQQLAATLGCVLNDLDAEVQKYSTAATEEYLRMILGQRTFSRGQDIREYRLCLLIREVFAGRLPTEQQVGSIFKTTITQSRALLRSTISKYQYELQPYVRLTLKEVLDRSIEVPDSGGRRQITVDSDNIIAALNREIIMMDGTLPQVAKMKNTASTYQIAKSSYASLCERLK
jgi:hypothetical protein